MFLHAALRPPIGAATTVLVAALALLAGVALPARADSLASSASSAGSASSGSVSDSFKGSSNSSRGDDRRAAVDYRVVEIAAVPERAGMARLVLQADDPADRVALVLPGAIVAAQALVPGDRVQARSRVYGLAFARGAAAEAFFLVLDDDWSQGLVARPVPL